mmetsp:Transcript_40892/g.94975  ORF Transcript_40892/g.94975 Transcript_40892/m.94975 type:complete len:237 (-) Transcript_40892:113-823(-)
MQDDPERAKVLAALGPRWQNMCRMNESTTFLWAHNGKSRTGWIQLLPHGKLSTTWCIGQWEVLANNSDVVEMCFGSSRHLCHYKEGGFMVEQKYNVRTGKDSYKPGMAKSEGFITRNDQRGHRGVPGERGFRALGQNAGKRKQDLSDDEAAEARSTSFLQKDLSFEAFFGAWSEWRGKRQRCFAEARWAPSSRPEEVDLPLPEESAAEAALRQAEEAAEMAAQAAEAATEAAAEVQ